MVQNTFLRGQTLPQGWPTDQEVGFFNPFTVLGIYPYDKIFYYAMGSGFHLLPPWIQ